MAQVPIHSIVNSAAGGELATALLAPDPGSNIRIITYVVNEIFRSFSEPEA